MFKTAPRKFIAFMLFTLLSQALPLRASQTADQEQIGRVLNDYKEAVNSRNQEALLSTYASSALINVTIAGKKGFHNLGEYAKALPEKFKEWDKASVKILSFEIKGLNIYGDKAEALVKAKGQRYFFSGSMDGWVELQKQGQNWKIILDDL